MTQDKKVIYVNGDSFTEGCDTADYLLPFETTNYSLNDIRTSDPVRKLSTIKRQQEFIKKRSSICSSDANLADMISKETKKNRWSSELERLLGKQVMNLSSHGGSSMFAICYRTISDIYELVKRGYEVTDILLQVTAMSRTSVFQNIEDREEPVRSHLEHKRYMIKSGNIFYSTEDMKDYVREYFTLEKPGFNLYRYFHDLYVLKHTLKSMVPNARLIFLDSAFHKNTIYPPGTPFEDDVDLRLLGYNHVLDFKKEFEETLDLCMLNFLNPDEKELSSGLHFTKTIHDRFAEAVAERYFK